MIVLDNQFDTLVIYLNFKYSLFLPLLSEKSINSKRKVGNKSINSILALHLGIEVEAFACRSAVNADSVRQVQVLVAVLLKGHGLPDSLHVRKLFLLASIRSSSFIVVNNSQINEEAVFQHEMTTEIRMTSFSEIKNKRPALIPHSSGYLR